jgi:peptide deformylase
MASLNILRYPDARLHKVAAPVTVFDEALKKLVADMAETMYAAPGNRSRAIQVDVPKQVIVVDVSERRDSLVVLVNPEIVKRPACPISRKAASRCPESTSWSSAPSA